MSLLWGSRDGRSESTGAGQPQPQADPPRLAWGRGWAMIADEMRTPQLGGPMPAKSKDDEKTTTPSVGQGPTQNQETEAKGAATPRAGVASRPRTEEEMAERAEQVAASAMCHRWHRAGRERRPRRPGSGPRPPTPSRPRSRRRWPTSCDEIADSYEAAAEGARPTGPRSRTAPPSPSQVGGTPSGPPGRAPARRGDPRGRRRLPHPRAPCWTPPGWSSTSGPRCPRTPTTPRPRRAAGGPTWSPSPCGAPPAPSRVSPTVSGAGQFQLASELEDDERGLPEGQVQAETPYRHEIQ